MQTVILVDADILVYSVAFGVETPIYVVGGAVFKRRPYAEAWGKKKGYKEVKKRVNIGSEQDLRTNLNTKLKQMYDDLGTSNAKLYLTESKVKGNFRSELATILPYKGNRTDSIKPYHYKTIREILINEYKAILVEGQEADDAIAIEQTRIVEETGSYNFSYIASIDKDLRTVPGQHYNLNSRTIDFVPEDVALKNFYRQLLVGDATDNIPGLYKLLAINDRHEEATKLKHSKYLKTFNELIVDYSPEDTYNYVLGMYEGYGFGEKELKEIGNLLHLRRHEGEIWSETNVK